MSIWLALNLKRPKPPRDPAAVPAGSATAPVPALAGDAGAAAARGEDCARPLAPVEVTQEHQPSA